MLWALLAAAASTAPHAGTQPPPTRPVVIEARATVTILSGVRVKFDSPMSSRSDVPPVHDASITTNGTRQPARLVEFE
jgi:hypothetical protein